MDSSAEIARSILACHGEVELTVDGAAFEFEDDAPLGLQDWFGTPTFVCRPEAGLSGAAGSGRPAMLHVASGLATSESLILSGRLRLAQAEMCGNCNVTHDHVVVDLSSVLLVCGRRPMKVDLEEFADPDLQLNSGYLHRNQQHINTCHDHLLRDIVARRTGTHSQDILAAQVFALKPDGVELQWVTGTGAHRTELRFPVISRTITELAAQLRRSLHPDLC